MGGLNATHKVPTSKRCMRQHGEFVCAGDQTSRVPHLPFNSRLLSFLVFFVSLTLSLVLTSPCTLNCADRHGAPPSGVDLLACRRRAKHTFCCCLSLSPALFFHTVPPSSDVAQGRLPPWLDVSHRGASKIGRVRTLIVLAGGFNV